MINIMSKYYIFASDPHGTGQPWIDKVNKAYHDYPSAKIVFGGDYIDGRKYSKDTVDYIMNMTKKGHIALMGNHEQLMLDAVSGKNMDLWNINGAKTTIKSFCGRSWSFPKRINFFKYMNTDFIEWARKLPDIFVTSNIVFVHAGLNLNKEDPINQTSHYDKIWIRDEYIKQPNSIYFAHNPLKKTIVTGHTPTVFINGKFDDTDIIVAPPSTCPVIEIKYDNEFPRFFTDGGCHGNNTNTGNIVVLNESGKLEKVYF